MSWLKSGFWVLVGVVGLSGASACGARGNLDVGEFEPLGGATAAGGASARGGAQSAGAMAVGGTPVVAGAPAFGGATAFGGSLGFAGTVATGGVPSMCAPGSVFCDGTSRYVLVCSADGQSASSNLDCLTLGKRCQGGACLCADTQTDCNGSPKDGCETNISTSPDNCASCGLVCSSNHVAVRTCGGGVCNGTCEAGYQDCNGEKLKDGCETNINTDVKNCGGCGASCLGGLSCAGGKCTSLYTFTGTARNLPIASLAGWSQCFAEPYGQKGTPLDKVKLACPGSQLMLACRPKGAAVLQLAAYAPRADVLFDTAQSNLLHVANGVGWYYSATWSWGFAPPNEVVERSNCDIANTAADQRMCWHTADGGLDGGYRCGSVDNLNMSFDYERLVFQAP